MSSYPMFQCRYILICKRRIVVWLSISWWKNKRKFVCIALCPMPMVLDLFGGTQHPFPPWFSTLKSSNLLELKGWRLKVFFCLAHVPWEFRILYRFCQWDPPMPYLEGRQQVLGGVHPSAPLWADRHIAVAYKQQVDSHIYCQFLSLLGGGCDLSSSGSHSSSIFLTFGLQ